MARIEPVSDGIYMTVKAARVLDATAIGDSIAINGACQTVTRMGADTFTVFCSRVTLSVTTLGAFTHGTPVNLERALTPSSRFGGHMVQGHVDGKGTVKKIIRDANGSRFDIAASGDIMRYIVQRGSVAVDGVSLTVVSAHQSGFDLYIIPETIQKTTLNTCRPGDEVNIEVDILAKYIEKFLQNSATQNGSNDEGLMKKLAEGGFI